MRWIYVDDLVRRGTPKLQWRVLEGGAGLGRVISCWKVLRPKMSIWAEKELLVANRPLIFGAHELGYLQTLPPERRVRAIRMIPQQDVPCVVIEGGHQCPQELLEMAREHSIPILWTRSEGPRLTRALVSILKGLMGSPFHIQGVLLRVFNVGVLIMGKSGIGKSECALDLIDRGHALVADDFIELGLDDSGRVIGRSPELIRNRMEVRGLGILNVVELFGPRAVVETQPINLVVELLEWEQFLEEDRSGLQRRRFTLLNRDLPLLRIPVSLNRNVAILVEVAVRKHLLPATTISSAAELDDRVGRLLRGETSQ